MHPVLQSLPFLTPSFKIAVSYLDQADVTRAQLEFYMASVLVILLLLCTDNTDTTLVSYDKRFRDFWGEGHVLISRQYHLMFLLLEHDVEG